MSLDNMEEEMFTKSELTKSVECAICRDRLYNPKHLPCHHSFCKLCLDNMIKFEDDGSAILKCPFNCKQIVSIKRDETTNCLPSNYSLQHLLQILKESDKGNKNICQETHDCINSATQSCSVCSSKTCNSCRSKHTCFNRLFLPITFNQQSCDFQPICEEHQTIVTLCCIDCEEQFVCIYCANRTHKGHKTETLEKHTMFTRNILASKFETAKEYFIQSRLSYKDELSKIGLFREELVKELQDRQVKRLKQYMTILSKQEQDILEDFDKQVLDFKGSLQDINHSTYVNIVDSLSSYAEHVANKQDYEVLLERHEIIRRFDALSNIQCFKAVLQDGTNEKDLAHLELMSFPSSYTRNDDKFKVVDTEINRVYHDYDVSVTNDLKDVKEYIKDLEGAYHIPDNDVTSVERTETNSTKIVKDCYEESILQQNIYTYEDVYGTIRNDELDKLKHMLTTKPGVIRLKDEARETFFHKAAAIGNFEALEMLLKHNKKHVNDPDIFGSTALMNASGNGHTSCAELLIRHRAFIDISTTSKGTALMLAAGNGHYSCIELLLHHGADINLWDGEACTALMTASRNGHATCVELLLEHQPAYIDINGGDKCGYTALMFAAQYGHFACIKLLVKYGADVELKTKNGWTALMHAAHYRNFDSFNTLVSLGANIYAKNNDLHTAFDVVNSEEDRSMLLLWANNLNNT